MMDLKKIDLDKLQDYAFTLYELAMVEMVSDQKFINIKCLDNESIVPTVKAIPLDKVKQAREEISEMRKEHNVSVTDCLDVLDKLIAESEE